MFNIEKILVPTDFSEASEAAMDYATALASSSGARVYVLHVPGQNGENFEADFPFAVFENGGWQRFAPFRPQYAVRIGTAAHEIVRYAANREVDLIVMGTHGRSGLPHVVLGSVAEHVVREAACPVLTVRPARRPVAEGDPLRGLASAGAVVD